MREWRAELGQPKPISEGRKLSTRLIRKGALLEDTHRVFLEWELTKSFEENLSRARDLNTPAADNQGWLKEVVATMSSRWRSEPRLTTLIQLAQRANFDIWRPCVLWHIGQVDELYYRFATEWLFGEYEAGAYQLRTADVMPFVEKLTSSRAAGKKGLSEYGLKRAARDLLRMAADFGLMKGSAVREFTSYHLPEESFLYLLHTLYEVHGNARDVVHSPDWRLFLMSTADVERELFRLHQFRKLRYEVAGSLVELTLPCRSVAAFVEEMAV
ncbi:MAG: BrxA family protein [Candidatus Thiodiazotropha sp.]